jgi:hypothetical protein
MEPKTMGISINLSLGTTFDSYMVMSGCRFSIVGGLSHMITTRREKDSLQEPLGGPLTASGAMLHLGGRSLHSRGERDSSFNIIYK